MGTIKDHVAVIVNNVGWISSEVFGNTWPSHPHSQHTLLNADDHDHYMLNTAGVNRQFTGDVYFQERLVGNPTLILDDHFRTLQSTWTHEGLDLSRDQSEWVDFFNLHGNVSLLRALNQVTAGLDQFAIGFGSAADLLTGDATNFHYTATRQVHIGAATPANLASTNDSLFVAGQTELTGSVFEMGNVWALGDTRFSTGTLIMYDNRPLCFGTGSDAQMGFYDTDESFQIGVPTATNYMVICQKADLGHAWGRAAEINPTFIIQSADNASHGKNIKLRHGGTDAEIEAGAGTIRFIDQHMAYGSWDPVVGLRIGDSVDWAAAKALAGGVETTLLDLIIHAAGVGGCTLDGAYDYGGAGAGYFINVDTNQLAFQVPNGVVTTGALKVSVLDDENTHAVFQISKASTLEESIEFLGAGGSVDALGDFPPTSPGHLLYTSGDAISLIKYHDLNDTELYPSYAYSSVRRIYTNPENYKSRAVMGTSLPNETYKAEVYTNTYYSGGAWYCDAGIQSAGDISIVSTDDTSITATDNVTITANGDYANITSNDVALFLNDVSAILNADDTAHSSIGAVVGTYPSTALYLQDGTLEAWLCFGGLDDVGAELCVYGDTLSIFGQNGLWLESEGALHKTGDYEVYSGVEAAQPLFTLIEAQHYVPAAYCDEFGDVLEIDHKISVVESEEILEGTVVTYWDLSGGYDPLHFPARSIARFELEFISTDLSGSSNATICKIVGYLKNTTDVSGHGVVTELSNTMELSETGVDSYSSFEPLENYFQPRVTVSSSLAMRHVLKMRMVISRLGWSV